MVGLRLAARSKVCRSRVLCCPATPALVLPGVPGARAALGFGVSRRVLTTNTQGNMTWGGSSGRSRQGEVLQRGRRLPFGLVVRAGAGQRVAAEKLTPGKDALEAGRRVGIDEVPSHAPGAPNEA